jgi:hypothetical protein
VKKQYSNIPASIEQTEALASFSKIPTAQTQQPTLRRLTVDEISAVGGGEISADEYPLPKR